MNNIAEELSKLESMLNDDLIGNPINKYKEEACLYEKQSVIARAFLFKYYDKSENYSHIEKIMRINYNDRMLLGNERKYLLTPNLNNYSLTKFLLSDNKVQDLKSLNKILLLRQRREIISALNFLENGVKRDHKYPSLIRETNLKNNKFLMVFYKSWYMEAIDQKLKNVDTFLNKFLNYSSQYDNKDIAIKMICSSFLEFYSYEESGNYACSILELYKSNNKKLSINLMNNIQSNKLIEQKNKEIKKVKQIAGKYIDILDKKESQIQGYMETVNSKNQEIKSLRIKISNLENALISSGTQLASYKNYKNSQESLEISKNNNDKKNISYNRKNKIFH